MNTELLEKPTVRRGWDVRMTVGAVLVVVFLSGAAAGAVAMGSRAHLRMHQQAFETAAGRALSFDRLQRELSLTPAQAEQVSSILADMWQYYRTVLTDSKARVEQVLTPQQRDKFEHLLREQR
jgi:Spy/CpxP family protein refolding chaperone